VGLGLDKLGRRKTLVNSDAVWGMICKVRHMVRVVEDTK
jgi:ribosomal protein L30/L7E